MINSGYSLKEPAAFAKRFYRLLNGALGIPKDAPIEEYEVEIEEDEEEEDSNSFISLTYLTNITIYFISIDSKKSETITNADEN